MTDLVHIHQRTGNLLAFDTGTELMSIAVCRLVLGRSQIWQHTVPGGARASVELIPAILSLLQQADLRLQDLQAICFGAGPASFTGLRTACAVAQGLALGANQRVLPVDSLLAVAEEARHTALLEHRMGTVTALLDARMNEVYAATWAFDAGIWTQRHASVLAPPEDLSGVTPTLAQRGTAAWVMAGNVFSAYGTRIALRNADAAEVPRIAAQPTASAMLRLAPQLLAAGLDVAPHLAWPHYVRDKVAKTTAERAAEKAAQAAAV